MGRDFGWSQGRYKICDSFTVSLTVPKKLHSKVAVFTPADYRYFHGQGSSFLRYRDLQREIGSLVQPNVATHSAASGRKVQ